jgi:orotidine-5'-phosphate decarboxylase
MRGYADRGEAVRAFNRLVIGALCDIIPAVSVNVPLLLQYGVETVHDAVSYAKEKGMYTIADAKCSGEPTASAASANLYFDMIDADCVTVNAYYGASGIAPLFEKGREMEKSVFVLAHSESGSPHDIQDLMAGLRPVYKVVCDIASRLGEKSVGAMGYSNVGIICGGLSNSSLSEIRRTYKKTLMLITGYDGEKVEAHDLNGAFDLRGLGGLVSVGRVITLAKGEGAYSERIRKKAEEVVRDLKVCF